MEGSITLRRLIRSNSIYVFIVVILDIRLRIVSPKEEAQLEKSVLRLPLCQCHSLCPTLTLLPTNLWVLQTLSLSWEKPFCRHECPAVCGIRWGAYSIWSVFLAICICSILGWFLGCIGLNSILFLQFQFIYRPSPIDPCTSKIPIPASDPHMHFDQ